MKWLVEIFGQIRRDIWKPSWSLVTNSEISCLSVSLNFHRLLQHCRSEAKQRRCPAHLPSDKIMGKLQTQVNKIWKIHVTNINWPIAFPSSLKRSKKAFQLEALKSHETEISHFTLSSPAHLTSTSAKQTSMRALNDWLWSLHVLPFCPCDNSNP